MMKTNLIESPKEAAEKFYKKLIREGFVIVAEYTYTNADGSSSYWRFRFENLKTEEKTIRPIRLTHNKYEAREPDSNGKKPIYNLYALTQNPHDDVWIVEGEKSADALTKIGILSTTSGNSTSAKKADWNPLQKRTVHIWPDNDDIGKNYGNFVLEALSKLQCKVDIIDVEKLNLPEKGDVFDWLKKNPGTTREEFLKIFLKDSTLPAKEVKDNMASELVKYVLKNSDLFHDSSKNVYSQDKSTLETRALEGRQFRDWLVSSYYQKTGRSPREQAVKEALHTLMGVGRFDGECKPVFLRIALFEGSYYLDLGQEKNSKTVKISPGEWVIIENPPVRFIRPESMLPLPAPMKNGCIDAFWKIANIPSKMRTLVVAWLIECLRPETPFPLMELIGEQGSAKSTTQAALRKLIDPNACNLRSSPKNAEEVFVSAGSSWLVSYENVSFLHPLIQDGLCTLATGGGYAKRKLYTNFDETVVDVKRPIILNGISIAVTAQDLIDRTVTIDLPNITHRSEVNHLWESFEKSRAEIIGGIIDIMCGSLNFIPTIQIPMDERPRLIEFVILGMAISQFMGRQPAEFLSEFNSSREDAIARTIDGMPVASAVIDWMALRPLGHTDTVKNLMKSISHSKPDNASWPTTPKGFADALRRAAPALRQIHIECKSEGRKGGNCIWSILPMPKIHRIHPVSPTSPDRMKDIRTSRTSVNEELLDAIEERAAIFEADAGLTREEADRAAMALYASEEES